MRGEWMGREITFFSSTEHHAWYGLAGVDVEAKPGSYKLSLQTTLSDGTVVRDEQTIVVQSGHYKTEKLTVPEKFVQPDPETLQRIQAEKKIKDAAFSHAHCSARVVGKIRSAD